VTQERWSESEMETRTFQARPFAQRVRHVCTGCNVGWMSSLEEEAKPVLTPMIQGRGKELHAGDQRQVATWAFKTAAMFDLVGIKGGGFPREHLRWLFDHRDQPNPLPPYMHVWLAACRDGEAVPVFKQHGLRLEGEGIQLAVGERNGYSATFTVGHLALQVFGATVPEGVLVTNAGQFAAVTAVQIWPPPGRSVIWPPARLLTAAGIDAWADGLLSDRCR
jgi:hypothetical protein